MSLLNDALRAAEERQTRPQVTGSYTGQPVAQPSGASKAPVVIVVITLLVLIGGAAAWWLSSDGPVEAGVVAENVSTAAVPEPAAPAVTPEPLPVEPIAVEPVARIDAPEPEPLIAQRPVEAPVTETVPEPAAQAPASTGSQASAEPVKQQRETPKAIDLRTSRDLSRLLATGQTGEAERTLTELTSRQSAPRSRAVFAREMLVQGMAARSLDWLPDALTNEHANLRLLKARALLTQGELDGAVATLATRVPPVAEQVEYRITLATLLQQAGEADDAAGHWSELIAYDDSQAAWWLGLAIALEAGGRNRSAVQAYAQAMAMPGLSASLADYARERLLALQAGS